MNDEEYMMTQHQLAAFAGLMVGLDLAGFIERANTAESVGAILDPTLYRKAGGRLRKMIALAEAGVQFQTAALALQEEVGSAPNG